MTTKALFAASIAAVIATAIVWRLARAPRPTPNDSRPAKNARRRHGNIVFKICPDCRELVYLEAPVCKYCGCALAVMEPEKINSRMPPASP
jgi:hypothetical protein